MGTNLLRSGENFLKNVHDQRGRLGCRVASHSRQVAMEVMGAPELDDKASARRSLDLTYLDDIPEERALERALSGKSSEEKEITRLDSGLGEWDSESSRKTSFSSQGRLSPDFAMAKDPKETSGVRSDISNNKDSVKR